ncbi:MAG: AEC family transporter [Burkholderiales bacterium]|nr:AEC family transporter [Burkholderiales bacterium]NBO76097.1 AEC family transporter [Betaproteobacteria bacterium]
MTLDIFLKLLVLVAVVGAGWYAGRSRLMPGPEPVQAISTLAFYLLIPALLFRAMAKVDLAHLPWSTLLAFFGPTTAWVLVVYAFSRWQMQRKARVGHVGRAESSASGLEPNERDAATPATRSIMCSFGNTIQVGLPLVASLFGDAGLVIHVAIISLHALTLLTVATVLAEVDIARARHAVVGGNLWGTVRQTVRNTLIHPVILPVIAGLAWNLLGLPVPQPMDEALQLLASGVVPLCLVMIGLSLAHYGIKGYARLAVACTVGKMLVMPAAVLGVAHWGLGLSGLPLTVIVLVASLPTGSNALLFAQRYQTQVPQATATIVVGTVAFAALAPMWLQVLSML